MLFTQKTAAEKRAGLRLALASDRLLRFPGAMSPLVATIIERQGWDGVYISGAVIANELGMPDIGLTSMSEVVERGRQIARATDLPAIIDIDTGFGEPMAVARTVRELEDAGLAGCHLEDQTNPKRCGHLDGKAIVPVIEMVRKIKAAIDARRDPDFLIIARSDAAAVEGLDGAIARMKAYQDAGADVIFAEAMRDENDFAAVRKALTVPVLANMTEFGKSRLMDADELSGLGINIVIYPVTSLRLAMKAVEDGLAAIRADGHQNQIVDRMLTRKRLYELVRYEDYNAYDQSIFNFAVSDQGSAKSSGEGE